MGLWKVKIFVSRPLKFNFFSWLISIGMGVEYSHIGILINDITVYQTTGSGFGYMTKLEFLSTHEIVGAYEITNRLKASKDFVTGWLTAKFGGDYGQSQLLAIALPLLRPILKNGNSREICSETVARFLNDTGVYKFSLEERDFISPEDIWNKLISLQS